MSNAKRINTAVDALMKQEGAAYTAGFLVSQLAAALEYMPKTKQAMFMGQFEAVVGSKVKVEVVNILSGKPVLLAWDQVGGPCDPSTERYHSM